MFCLPGYPYRKWTVCVACDLRKQQECIAHIYTVQGRVSVPVVKNFGMKAQLAVLFGLVALLVDVSAFVARECYKRLVVNLSDISVFFVYRIMRFQRDSGD